MEPIQLGVTSSTSLPQLTKAPQLLSGSGSFQTYLSSTGSYHRHAKNTIGAHLENQSPQLTSPPVESSPHSRLVRFIYSFPGFLLEDIHRLRYPHLGTVRFFLSLYCCVSVLFLSFKMHSALRGVVAASRPHNDYVSNTQDTTYRVSPLTNLSIHQRMSIAFPNIPLPCQLETFILAATHSSVDNDLTACLWVEEERLHDILATITTWPGPMSLVIVTSASSTLTDRLTTLKKIPKLMGLIDTHASSRLFFHFLQVSSSSGGSANAFLNVARLLAPTDRVVLFPDGLPSHLSTNMYGSIFRMTSPLPLVLGNDSRVTYPFVPMSPLVLPKYYPVWCTERFSLFRSRPLDWEDCLWQIWLESGGEVKSAAVDGWPGEQTAFQNVSRNSALSAKIRRRWTVKYRVEACALAMKRAHVLDTASYADKEAFQWRKKFCHEYLGLSTPNAV